MQVDVYQMSVGMGCRLVIGTMVLCHNVMMQDLLPRCNGDNAVGMVK
jgi:hypothetical protein